MLARILVVVLLGVSLVSCSTQNQDPISALEKMTFEKQLEFFPEVSFDDLKDKIAMGVTVVDVNHPKTFQTGHIPTAQNFTMNAKNLSEILPSDKTAEIVTYCGSPTCTAWLTGAKEIHKLGYENVTHFHGGLAGWVQAGGELENGEQQGTEHQEHS